MFTLFFFKQNEMVLHSGAGSLCASINLIITTSFRSYVYCLINLLPDGSICLLFLCNKMCAAFSDLYLYVLPDGFLYVSFVR